MDRDDIIYTSLLGISIALGPVIQKLESPSNRQWTSTLIGFLLVTIVSGIHVIHPLITTLVNIIIILYTPKKTCHILSFIFSFTYLTFFRITEWFGIPYPPGHTNLIQMMLTLKLVGLAFEIHDEYMNKEKKEKNYPSILDIWHYSFCYVGVLTGPFYRYRTYLDWLDWSCPPEECKNQTISKAKMIPFFAIIFLISNYYFPLKYTLSDEFYMERSWLYRLWYITPIFLTFRMRMYIGLLLSECVCTMAGLGAYPISSEPRPGRGPAKDITLSDREKDDKISFETIHNIDPYGSDFHPTGRESMRAWNMCIQYWLAVHIYKRCPWKGLRVSITMLVSSLWHGVHAGYYLCLLSVPLYLPAEDLMVKLVPEPRSSIMHVLFIFYKIQSYGYMGSAFSLLSIDATIRYWRSIGFFFNVLWVAMYVFCLIIIKSRPKKKVSPELDEKTKSQIKTE